MLHRKEDRMKTIVVPLDGSPLAERALPYAQYLATLYNANIRLIDVVPDPLPEPATIDTLPHLYHMGETITERHVRQQALHKAACDRAEGYLFSQAVRLRGQGLQVSADVCGGPPAEAIVQHADQSDTLVVMATHGRSGLRRWALGSVADGVVHLGHTPVLLVRATGDVVRTWSIRRIVVPLDGSRYSQQALPLAADLADQAGADLIFVQVLTPLLDLEGGWGALPGDFDAQRRTDACAELHAIADEYRARDLHVTPIVTFGYPAEEIMHASASHDADLIVMATHGRSGVQRVVLGSVADKLLHATATPLLLVHPLLA